MNIRSILRKLLLLIPAALSAPLLAVANPVICTSGAVGDLDLNSSVNFPEGIAFHIFTCPNVTFAPPTTLSSDIVSVVNVPGTGTIIISADSSMVPYPDADVVFTGSSPTYGNLQFAVSEVNSGPQGTNPPSFDMLSVTATPEPGSMLLLSTGLLIAGGFIRRRLLRKTFA